jgi:hypothetical protein
MRHLSSRTSVFEGIVFVIGALALACSSSSTGVDAGSGGGSTYSCQIVNTGKNECDTARGVPSGDLTAQEAQCTQNMSGKIVPACPTTSVIGCCTVTLSPGVSVEGCFYTGETKPTTQAQCTASGGTYSTTP